MERFSVVRDPLDAVAASPPVSWALDRLAERARDVGICVRIEDRDTPDIDGSRLLVATTVDALVDRWLTASGVGMPTAAESFALVPGDTRGQMLVFGADARALVYAVFD